MDSEFGVWGSVALDLQVTVPNQVHATYYSSADSITTSLPVPCSICADGHKLPSSISSGGLGPNRNPYTLSIHSTPCTLKPIPYTLYSKLLNLNPESCSLISEPLSPPASPHEVSILYPVPYTLVLHIETSTSVNPIPYTLHTLSRIPQFLNVP